MGPPVRDPYDPLAPIRRLLEGSWHVARLFGIDIRVYWTSVLVFLVSAYEFSTWPGVGPGEAVLLGALFQAGLYVIVLAHELCHAWAGRRYHIRTPTITLSALGGLAHMSAPAPSPRADIVISAAGPASHLPWIALAWLLRDVVPPLRVGSHGWGVDTMSYLLWTNVTLAAFNLLPCLPMDGGRILRGLLAMKRHPNWASLAAGRVGVLGAIAFMAYGMSQRGFGGSVLLVIGVVNLQASLREITAAKYGDGPYAPVDPWGQDADAWKRGADPLDRPAGRGFWSVLRRRESTRPPADRRPPSPLVPRGGADADDDAELDRLLAKVAATGLPGLTDAERARLHVISASRRARR